MIEILPIGFLNDEDNPLYGSLNVLLGQLSRSGYPVASGIVITPPSLHLQTTLEHYDFNSREIFEQNLTLVKKEVAKIPVPEILTKEVGKHDQLWLSGQVFKNPKDLWLALLDIWLTQVKTRLWEGGFRVGLTADLEPQIVVFTKKVSSFGKTFFEPEFDEAVIHIESGKLEPPQAKELDELIQKINKKLLIPYEYDWILDGQVKLVGIKPYIPSVIPEKVGIQTESHISGFPIESGMTNDSDRKKTTVKVFADLSEGLVVEKEIDGVFIAGEKIFNLNKPQESFEELVFKLVESAQTYPDLPILLKLADESEGMGKTRGSLRLIHQKSLLNPMCEALLFTRNKKELKNIYLVVPFVRGVTELMQIKRELAIKKLIRKNNLQIWLELAVPENIINLEEYLVTGVDGVVLNLDELSAHFNGYDHTEENLSFYKTEVAGMLKYLEEGLKLLHKSKVPFITTGSLSLNSTVLEFLVERGVLGIVTQRYETHSMSDLLHQAEKRIILKKTT